MDLKLDVVFYMFDCGSIYFKNEWTSASSHLRTIFYFSTAGLWGCGEKIIHFPETGAGLGVGSET